MRLPDPARSRAILVGAGYYHSDHVADVPSVRANLADLAAALTDPGLGGLAPERCTVLADPGLRDAYRALRNAALDCDDTLVVYFAGHGFTGDHNELFLGVTDTDPAELDVSALRIGALRDLLLRSPARAKVVILDCCFAGRAFIDHMAEQTDVILGQVDVAGTYTLASARANELAIAAPGATHTAFTGELLGLLQKGVAGGPELLTFELLFPLLYRALYRQGLPLPDQRNTGTISGLALSRNPAARPTTAGIPRPAEPNIEPSPAGDPELLPTDRHDPSADSGLNKAATADTLPPTSLPTRGRRGARRRLLAATGAAAAVLVLVNLVPSLLRSQDDHDGGARSPSSSASVATSPTTPAARRAKPTVNAGTGTLAKLRVITLIPGDGPKVKKGQTIMVNYAMVAYASGDPIESSWDSGEAFQSSIGTGHLIKGWDQGVVGVPVGSRIQLDIPADLAFGEEQGDVRTVIDIISAV
ncbi:FKBP-type peptidyl-prolyl cis-trans isomerase [Actinoplanes sp. GCM10030250]|uniref:caspase, EACC1-associated type n=1 Tax=Actinoplanes sp. GCM10030250 TaxID=3273376 RepID=UPI003606B4EE